MSDLRPPDDGQGAQLDVPPAEPGTVAALRRLDTVPGLALEQRPDVFQAIHDDLRSALAEIDDA